MVFKKMGFLLILSVVVSSTLSMEYDKVNVTKDFVVKNFGKNGQIDVLHSLVRLEKGLSYVPDNWFARKSLFVSLRPFIGVVDSFTQESSMIFKPAIKKEKWQSTLKKLMTGNDKDGLKYMDSVVKKYTSFLKKKEEGKLFEMTNQEGLSRAYQFCLVRELVNKELVPVDDKINLRENPYKFVQYVNNNDNNICTEDFDDLVHINVLSGCYFEEGLKVQGLGFTHFEEVGKNFIPSIKKLVGEK